MGTLSKAVGVFGAYGVAGSRELITYLINKARPVPLHHRLAARGRNRRDRGFGNYREGTGTPGCALGKSKLLC